MPVTTKLLRDISEEALPILRRQKDDAELIAGLRNTLAAQGGDWSALKALLKAQVDDEADDDGEGKRVRKILDKAGSSTAYADMLGLAKMNEENFSSASYSEAKGRGIDAAFVNSILVGGELTDNQESVGGADSASTDGTHMAVEDCDYVAATPSAVSPASDESEQDDVGATASSTNSNSQRPPAADTADDAPLLPASSATLSDPSQPTPDVPLGSATGERGADVAARSPSYSDDDDIPAFIKRPYQLRPNCLHPEMCASGTRDHCWSCKKQMAAEREAVEA